MSDNGWITDRLPTKDDGEIVLIWCHDRWSDMHYSQVMNGAVWMRQPEPYQTPSPEPDTSLTASIERLERAYAGGACHTTGKPEISYDCECIVCDKYRIIEAARKWDY